MNEIALSFRSALANDRFEAGELLEKHPELIDYPVYGNSESALHFFAVENHVDVVEWLLLRGANPDGVDERNFPLHSATMLGHENVCRMLLAAGANPNLQDFLGETALHKASSTGRITLIELLLVSGADPHIAEMCGELPADQALKRKRSEIVKVFSRHAAGRLP